MRKSELIDVFKKTIDCLTSNKIFKFKFFVKYISEYCKEN